MGCSESGSWVAILVKKCLQCGSRVGEDQVCRNELCGHFGNAPSECSEPDGHREFNRVWFRFGLPRTFWSIACYAIFFAAMRPLGTAGIVIAAVCGTTSSGIVFLFRRKVLGDVLRVSLGAILGGAFGYYATDVLMRDRMGRPIDPSDIIPVCVLCAIMGSAIAAIFNHVKHQNQSSNE